MRAVTITVEGNSITNTVRGDSEIKVAFNAGVEWALGNLNVLIGSVLDDVLDDLQLAGYASTISIES